MFMALASGWVMVEPPAATVPSCGNAHAAPPNRVGIANVAIHNMIAMARRGILPLPPLKYDFNVPFPLLL